MKTRFTLFDYIRVKARYYAAFALVRPIRYAFFKMVCAGRTRWWFSRCDYSGELRYPNIHWALLYRTAFPFFHYLERTAWRHFCDWTGGWRQTYPWPARFIHTIGKTTAGFAIHGGQCYHCASERGCPSSLSEDETGWHFKLLDTWTASSECGTDYRFSGITTCPDCGHKSHYEDGSL